MRTLRSVQGVTYWVLEDGEEVRQFINRNVRAEWERDNLTDGVDSSADPWLRSLRRRRWALKTVRVDAVRLDPQTVARAGFTRRLEERSRELRRSVEDYGAVIWPFVVRGEDAELKDGYCRLATLRRMGVTETMAYVGVLHGERARGTASSG